MNPLFEFETLQQYIMIYVFDQARVLVTLEYGHTITNVQNN